MDLKLEGRVALITGGSRGIGFGIARALAAAGCKLHLASRSAEDLQRAVALIKSEHQVEVISHAMDLSRSDSVASLVRACGDIDILVNNAGAIPAGTLATVDETAWRQAWDLKVFGYINLTREIYPLMCGRRRGVIVNIAGTAGERPLAGYVAGSMGNAAIIALSRALGAESLDHGVRVIAVNPGPTETDRVYGFLKGRASAELGDGERWRELTARMPAGRLATVPEVANTVAFLCSDLSSYTSGIVVTIDGGASSRA
jgi:NAD(P)-dependent dehydrogenase (short-subunit alcohol dehydrogenase family)